jgi:hypothetical protein
MDTKKIIIGAASGLVANTIIQNGLRSSWAKIGINYSREAVALYDQFIKEGKKVSFAYSIWSPQGADKAFNFVASENNTLKIQELKEGVQPDTSFKVDDFEKEAINVASDLGATLTVETIKPFNKDQYMFIMAMTKSALESKGIQCNKESIDSFIKDMKLIYSYNF